MNTTQLIADILNSLHTRVQDFTELKKTTVTELGNALLDERIDALKSAIWVVEFQAKSYGIEFETLKTETK